MHRRKLLLLVGLLLAAGCGRPSSAAYTTQTTVPLPPVPTLYVPPPAPITFTGDAFDLHSPEPTKSNYDAAWAGVLDTLNRYLDAAILTPLRTGGPAGDIAPFFFPAALQQVVPGAPDRFAFIDENLPPVSDLRGERSVAGLTGLAASDGTMSVITAGLDLRLVGHIGGAPVTVVHSGELVFMPDGKTWRIDAYDVKVVRTLSEDTTVTTAQRD